MRTYFLTTAFAVASLGTVSVSSAQSIGLGAGTQGSQNYAVNAAFAQFLVDELGLDVRVQAYGGSGQSMPLIDTGRLDLQLVPSPDFAAAVLGEPPFDRRPLQNIRSVASLSSSAYGFMVRRDSQFRNVEDIAGHTITYGYAAQPTLRAQVDAILAAGGLSIDDMQTVNVPSVPNGVDDFISGNADVAFFATQGGKTREADASVGIRWLALEATPEAEAAMKEFVPTAYIKVIEPGATPGIDEPTPMMAYDYVLTAGTHVDDELITSIVQLIHDSPEKIRAINNTLVGFAVEDMAPQFDGLEYHPAATAFYQQNGLAQ